MRIEKTKNATRNIVSGLILKLYQILVPFLMRTIMIHFLGAQYLGLNSLFTSILSVLNLAELGVGSAMVYSMYKPIVEDDTTTICALMNLYRKYYRYIGLAILVIGLILTPFIPQLIKTNTLPSDVNVYVLYLMNLMATVLTYWLFSYKNCLLNAYQRVDVSSKITIVSSTVTYALQFLVLIFWKDFYLYTFIVLAVGVINNVITAIVVDRMYPDYRPSGELDNDAVKDIKQRVKDLFTSKLGGTIVNSADTVVISAFLGLTSLAIYQNYFYILSSVIGFVGIIYTSITAGVGNSMLTKSKEQNYKEFEIFTLLVTWVSGFCISCFLVLYQPFMTVWMGKDMLLSNGMVVLFCIYFWVYELVMMMSVYKDAAGIWHQDRFRPLFSGVVNLILNIVLVNIIGIYGVLLSTIISVSLVSLPWIINNVFKLIFYRKNKTYIKKLLIYSGIIGIVSTVTYLICSIIFISGWLEVIVKAIVCMVIPNILLILLLSRDEHFHDAKSLILRMLKLDRVIK